MRMMFVAALAAAMPVLPTPAAAVPAAHVFTCTPVAVWDGDGPIWCAEGPKIRLAGIAAREIDGSCRPHHPCPSARGIDARATLVSLIGRPIGRRDSGHVLVRGPALRCRSAGDAKGGRIAAWCESPSAGDLSCAMVASGHALKWDVFWDRSACRGGRVSSSGR